MCSLHKATLTYKQDHACCASYLTVNMKELIKVRWQFNLSVSQCKGNASLSVFNVKRADFDLYLFYVSNPHENSWKQEFLSLRTSTYCHRISKNSNPHILITLYYFYFWTKQLNFYLKQLMPLYIAVWIIGNKIRVYAITTLYIIKNINAIWTFILQNIHSLVLSPGYKAREICKSNYIKIDTTFLKDISQQRNAHI